MKIFGRINSYFWGEDELAVRASRGSARRRWCRGRPASTLALPEPSRSTPLLPALALSALKTISPLAPAAPPFALRLGREGGGPMAASAAARALAGRPRHPAAR